MLLAIRRYICRRQCVFALVVIFLVNLVFYFVTYDSISFPKWSLASKARDNRDELVELVHHLETEMENHSQKYKKHQKRKPRGPHFRSSCKRDHKLVVMVQSKVTNSDRRNIIRTTWGDGCTKCRKNKWSVFFLTGTSSDPKQAKLLADEAEQHGDFIPVDTIDTLKNITDKLKKGFTWLATHCRFDYLLKTNDNTFVNIPTLYQYFDHKDTPKEELYAGNVNWWSQVLRSGIYGVGPEYKRDFYPRYCSGAAYALSRDAVMKFVRNFKHVPYLFIEDAYIGEVALMSSIDVWHNKLFVYNQQGCKYNKTFISYHPVNTADCMMQMYQSTLPQLVHVYN